MNYKIEIRPLAAMEVIEAYNWYELQVIGLGLDFLDAVDDFYARLLVNPHTHSYYQETARHGVLSKFPYTVVYEVFDHTIIVYSVFMDRRDPAKKRTK